LQAHDYLVVGERTGQRPGVNGRCASVGAEIEVEKVSVKASPEVVAQKMMYF
jgi:hypothetical protein